LYAVDIATAVVTASMLTPTNALGSMDVPAMSDHSSIPSYERMLDINHVVWGWKSC
jgi:hypothetical protein